LDDDGNLKLNEEFVYYLSHDKHKNFSHLSILDHFISVKYDHQSYEIKTLLGNYNYAIYVIFSKYFMNDIVCYCKDRDILITFSAEEKESIKICKCYRGVYIEMNSSTKLKCNHCHIQHARYVFEPQKKLQIDFLKHYLKDGYCYICYGALFDFK
jgi:hypothetical protein